VEFLNSPIYDPSDDGPITCNMGIAGSIIGGAARNPIDQVREWGESAAGIAERERDREWDKEKTRGDREWKSGEWEKDRDWQGSNREDWQDWISGEGSKERDWRSGENWWDREWNTSEREASERWQSKEREAREREAERGRDWRSSERREEEDWASGEIGKDRQENRWQHENEWAEERIRQGRDQTWKSGESKEERKHESGMQDKDIAAGAAAQERDIEAKRQAAAVAQENAGYRTAGATMGLNKGGAFINSKPSGGTDFDSKRAAMDKGEASVIEPKKFDSDRSSDQRGEAIALDPEEKYKGASVNQKQPQRSIADENIGQANQSYLHAKFGSQSSKPSSTRFNLDNKQGTDMIGAQKIVSSWDNRGPSAPKTFGSNMLPKPTNKPEFSTRSRAAGNPGVSIGRDRVQIPSVKTRTRTKGAIHSL